MKIIKLMGGLGNQMQQYALYEKFISLGEEVYLDTSWFEDEEMQQKALAPRKLELDYFTNVTYQKPSKEQVKTLIGDDTIASKIKRKVFPKTDKHFYETTVWHPEIFTYTWGNAYLEGYWASEKYYADILPILRKRLVFSEPNEENKQVINQIKQSKYPVSIHIRRGDYLDPENAKMFGNICTEAYYEGAIDYIKARYPEAEFYIFSDDSEYVIRTYQGEEYKSIDINHGDNSYFDIYLMSQCKAHICANSTFSFWGARLNPMQPEHTIDDIKEETNNETNANKHLGEYKIMIRPSIHKNSQSFEPEHMHMLWKDWILIDNQGMVV